MHFQLMHSPFFVKITPDTNLVLSWRYLKIFKIFDRQLQESHFFNNVFVSKLRDIVEKSKFYAILNVLTGNIISEFSIYKSILGATDHINSVRTLFVILIFLYNTEISVFIPLSMIQRSKYICWKYHFAVKKT